MQHPGDILNLTWGAYQDVDTDVYECRRADRDKDMGPQPAAALPVLALSPD